MWKISSDVLHVKGKGDRQLLSLSSYTLRLSAPDCSLSAQHSETTCFNCFISVSNHSTLVAASALGLGTTDKPSRTQTIPALPFREKIPNIPKRVPKPFPVLGIVAGQSPIK
eukprot:5792043-Amphidinium_carterae.1